MRILCIFFLVATAFGCGDNLDVLSIKDNKISGLEKQLSAKEQSEKLKDDEITKLDNKIKELEKKDNSTEINKLKTELEDQKKAEKSKDDEITKLDNKIKDNFNEINGLKKNLIDQQISEKLKDDEITKLSEQIKELKNKDNSKEINDLKKKLEEQETLGKEKDEKIKKQDEKLSIKNSVNSKNEAISNRFGNLYLNDVNNLSKKIIAKLNLIDKGDLLKTLSIYFFNKLDFQIRKIKNKHLSKEEKYHDLVGKKISDFDDSIKEEYIKDVIYENVKKELKIDLNSINDDIIADMSKVLNSCLQLVIDMNNANPRLEFLIPKPGDFFDSTFDDSDNPIYIQSVRLAGIKDEYTVYRLTKVSVTFSNPE